MRERVACSANTSAQSCTAAGRDAEAQRLTAGIFLPKLPRPLESITAALLETIRRRRGPKEAQHETKA